MRFRVSTLTVVIFTAVLWSAWCAEALAGSGERPNVILIFVDDLGYGDIGVQWQRDRAKAGLPAMHTPNIDRIGEQGVWLPNTYCPAPVCAPSRASLLLGVTQGHANVRDNQFDKALEDNHTMASVMRDAGYATVAIGKWGLQGEDQPNPDVPNKFTAHPMNRGFDYYFGYIRHRDGHMHYPKEDGKECYSGNTDISNQLDLCFTPDLFTARAKKWIIDHQQDQKDQPFFLYLAHDTPHAKLQNPPCAYPPGGGLKGGVQWLGTPGKMINTAQGTYDGWIRPEIAATDWPEQYKRYANLVQRIDDTVGDLVQLLSDLEIDDDTLVLFATDNGPSAESYLSGKPLSPTFFEGFGPFDGIKRDVWEGGIRTGMLASWPGVIPAGRVDHEPLTLADLMATFCDAAGAPIPARSDGVSVLPSMTGVGTQQSANIYIEYFNHRKTPNYKAFEEDRRNRKRGQMQAIRLGDYVGVRYDIKSHADDFEIYNITDDPKQANNLAGTPGMQEIHLKMKAQAISRRVPDASAPRPYDETRIPAVTGIKTLPGIDLAIFDRGDTGYVPKFGSDQSTATALTDAVADQHDTSGRNTTRLMTGYIDVPQDGTYRLELATSNRALLRLHEASVIDNDRPFKPGVPVKATVHLKQGLHPLRLYVNVDANAQTQVDLKWSGPGIDKPQTIPASAYRRVSP